MTVRLKADLRLPFQPNGEEQLARRRAAGHVLYQYTEEIELAVNAALVTGRPLLLRGTPGSGKSTLATDVANALDRGAVLEKVVTSRTTSTDFLWELDSVGRLSDAAAGLPEARKRAPYVRRGVLWNAFAPEPMTTRGAVVLLDEIDKADPDLPNDLLVPLGEERFVCTDTEPETPVKRSREVLVIITTNEERELPPAFLRRCVCLTLDNPLNDVTEKYERMKAIARVHVEKMEGQPQFDEGLLLRVIDRANRLGSLLPVATRRPGTAEVLDAYKASLKLGLNANSSEWQTLTRVLLHKQAGNPDAPAGTQKP